MFWILMALFQANPSRHAKYETCQKPQFLFGGNLHIPPPWVLQASLCCEVQLIWLYGGSNSKILWMVRIKS